MLSRASLTRAYFRSPLVLAAAVATLAACSEGPADGDGGGGSAGSAGTSPAGGSAGVGGGGAGMSGTSATGGSSGATASGGDAGTGTSGAAGAEAGASGSAGAGAGGASGGAGSGGDAGLGASGGSSGSSGDGGGGASGSAGDTGGGGSAGGGGAWTCPPGVTGQPALTATPARVASVPPPDAFNMENGNFGIIEGPVWIGDALYVSEMSYMPYDEQNSNVKMSRVLRVASDGTTTIHIADSGSNGLAVDANGDLVAAVHKDGTLTRFPMPSGAPAAPIASTYMSARFNSPNDLAIRSDGNIYFTDPNHQAPNTPPQTAALTYRVAPSGEITPIPSAEAPDNLGNPNGITLSLNEDFLYVAASVGRRYPVMSDGSVGAGEDFPAIASSDGMTVDCAGNLYVARNQEVAVFDANGGAIGSITVPEVQSVTNVAFGGADHQTLYIAGLGNQQGLFTYPLNLPGRPY